MNFAGALPTFLITFREGEEAALVIGFVLACLRRADRPDLTRYVAPGLIVGLIASALVGVGLTGLMHAMGDRVGPIAEPLFEGTVSLIAIGFLTWMLLWMTRHAKSLRSEIEGAVSATFASKSGGAGVFTLIFLAVVREGFETVLFIAARAQEGPEALAGVTLGIVASGLLGYAIFATGLRIPLRAFFLGMGTILLFIIAGLVLTALKQLDVAAQILSAQNREMDVCFYYERFVRSHSCVLGPMVYDASRILPDDHFPGVILAALLGYVDRMYRVQAFAHVVFLFTAGFFYFRSLRDGATQKANPETYSSRNLPLGPTP